MANRLQENYPIDHNDYKTGAFTEWAKDSYQVAIRKAYDGFKPGKKQDDSYLDLAKGTANRQMSLAGRRLAETLKEIVRVYKGQVP